MASDPIHFEVRGIPVTQGSGRAAYSAKSDHAYIVQDHRKNLVAWRHSIDDEVRDVMTGRVAFRGPVAILLVFYLPRPKGHYGAKGNLLPSAPALPMKKPDLDKLTRAAMDAMRGVAYLDDAQVTTATIKKRFAELGSWSGMSGRVWEEE